MSLSLALLSTLAPPALAGAGTIASENGLYRFQKGLLDNTKGSWGLPELTLMKAEVASDLSPTVKSVLRAAAERTPLDKTFPKIGIDTINNTYMFNPAKGHISLGGGKATSLLAHELGHLEQLKLNKTNYKVLAGMTHDFSFKAPLAAALVGGLAYGIDNDKVNPGLAALGTGLLLSSPSLALEADAWKRGNKILKGHLESSGRSFNKLRSAKTMVPWMSSIAGAVVAPAAILGVSDLLRKKLRAINESESKEERTDD